MDGLYPLSESHKSLCASTMFAGMIIGQLVGGFLGDVMGVSRAFTLTIVLQVVAALGSTLVTPPQVYWQLAGARFVLGMGAGGVYPLAAAMSWNASAVARPPPASERSGGHEGTEGSNVGPIEATLSADHGARHGCEGSKTDRPVALVFSMQGVAFVTMNAVALVLALVLPLQADRSTGLQSWAPLTQALPDSSSTNRGADQFAFRFLLGLGALPGVVVLGATWWIHRRRSLGRTGPSLCRPKGFRKPARPRLSLLDDVVEDTASGTEEEAQVALDPPSLPPSLPSSSCRPKEEELDAGAGARAASHALREALRDGRILRELVGCCLTWFLYDVCFFGNTLFQPVIGTALFQDKSPSDVRRHDNGGDRGGGRSSGGGEDSTRPSFLLEAETSLILALIALPGYFLSVWLIPRLGPRFVQIQGFVICATLYLVLAVCGERLTNAGQGGWALVFFGLSFTFFNFGPGATTYLFPSKLFPREVKATLNGVAAAAGKVGGWVGGYCFPLLLDAWTLEGVLGMCAAIALLGAGVTWGTLGWEGGREAVTEKGDKKTGRGAGGASTPLLPENGEARADEKDGEDGTMITTV
ncbi:hypothetical protein Naga_100118g8 [Nannochloropsis gaditana]|uniref:Major facilitator superfamily (MFS) profile domain-containing protein n=1 Tax=Nannochloropsis gaditana TaxID=72520 RepID=W7TFM4_9STRA|nr:hypothetical protein Naga_100118g8 [Nannochloropsis gaditana]